jgi:hypothetical protein
MEERSPIAAPANDTTVQASRETKGRARLIVRFALGVVDVTRERVGEVLAACDAAEPPINLEQPAAGAPISLPHAALGFLSDAGSRLAGAPARARARLRRMAESVRRRAPRLDRTRELVSGLPGVPRAAARLRAWHARGRGQLARWAEVGRHEQAQGRLLAFDALTVLRENMVARISESPDVKNVIREYSAGIAVTAMGALRERSARADGLVERTVGRFLHDGRPPRR